MSVKEKLGELWDRLKGRGPAAAVALTLDLGEVRDNKPVNLEAAGLVVEVCQGNLYAKINGPNGDGLNLKYTRRILYPFTALYLTNEAQDGLTARLLLVPLGMDVDTIPPQRVPPYCYKSHGLASISWTSLYVGPHANTLRASYTVPTGKKARVGGMHGQIIRAAVADSLNIVLIDAVIMFTYDMRVLHFNNTLGESEQGELVSELWLNQGDEIDILTSDNSTGGSMHYAAGIECQEVEL